MAHNNVSIPLHYLGWIYPLKQYEIMKNICSYLDPQSLFSFLSTARDLNENQLGIQRSFWSIDNSLKPFFQNPQAFRELMTVYGVSMAIFCIRLTCNKTFFFEAKAITDFNASGYSLAVLDFNS